MYYFSSILLILPSNGKKTRKLTKSKFLHTVTFKSVFIYFQIILIPCTVSRELTCCVAFTTDYISLYCFCTISVIFLLFCEQSSSWDSTELQKVVNSEFSGVMAVHLMTVTFIKTDNEYFLLWRPPLSFSIKSDQRDVNLSKYPPQTKPCYYIRNIHLQISECRV